MKSDYPNGFEEPVISTPCAGEALQVLFHKLKRLKPYLKRLNREVFADISGQVKEKRTQLEAQQLLNLANGATCDMTKEKQLQDELLVLEKAELLFYQQKAKINWLQEGDQGTRFFHSAVASKKKRNTIKLLFDDHGSKLETFDAIADELIKFFTNQIGTQDENVQGCSVDLLRELLPFSIPDEASADLIKEIDDDEIKSAIFGQGRDKAPGPDGYTAGFSKATWSIVGDDFIAAVKQFFTTSSLLPGFNATAVTLVLKVPNASKAKEFRPISCCSVFYKTITKILVTRLAGHFPQIISKTQSAFIQGRSIVDNTLLAQEIVKGAPTVPSSKSGNRSLVFAYTFEKRFSNKPQLPENQE
ncbi:hypothetical protein GQ457_05G005630 [Hibiscus cannabinus]